MTNLTKAKNPTWSFERSVEEPENISLGDTVEFTKTLTDTDIGAFARASGDTNPLHLDDEFAMQTRFGGRIVHGTLVSGLISAALARLPGLTIYLSQDLEFLRPVEPGETLTAVVEVIDILDDNRYSLSTFVYNEDDQEIIKGKSTVLIDDPPELRIGIEVILAISAYPRLQVLKNINGWVASTRILISLCSTRNEPSSCSRSKTGNSPLMKVNNLATNYTERGTGTPLVFIHGGWLSEKMWRNQIERFKDDYRVITYDIRGHGQTGGSPKSTYSIDLFVEDLRRLLTSLSVEMPVLCGLSLGGMIAQKYASRYANDVSGIILANTVQSFPPLPLTHAQKELLFPKIQRNLMLYGLGPQLYFRLTFPFFQLLEGHPWISLDQDTRDYVLRDVDRIHTDEFVKIFDAMYNCDLRNDIQITNPTLVITSDHEHHAVHEQNVQITKSIRNSSHIEIPNAGHLVNMDNSSVFNSEVSDFISGL